MKIFRRIAEKMIAIADMNLSESENQKCREGLTVLFAIIANLLIVLLIGIVTGTWKLVLALMTFLISIRWFIRTLNGVRRDMDFHDKNK